MDRFFSLRKLVQCLSVFIYLYVDIAAWPELTAIHVQFVLQKHCTNIFLDKSRRDRGQKVEAQCQSVGILKRDLLSLFRFYVFFSYTRLTSTSIGLKVSAKSVCYFKKSFRKQKKDRNEVSERLLFCFLKINTFLFKYCSLKIFLILYYARTKLNTHTIRIAKKRKDESNP